MPRPLFTPGKDPVPIVQEAGWAPGPVWTGAENFASTGIRFLDRPARSQSLYQLCYPAHVMDKEVTQVKHATISGQGLLLASHMLLMEMAPYSGDCGS